MNNKIIFCLAGIIAFVVQPSAAYTHKNNGSKENFAGINKNAFGL